MVTDTDLYSWFKELNMKVEKVASGNLYFHLAISPPMGGLPVSVIRTTPDSTYYIVAVVMELDTAKIQDRPDVLKEMRKELLRMNVEFFFTPNETSPKSVQVARIMFAEGLTKNEALNHVTAVKNAALMILELLKG